MASRPASQHEQAQGIVAIRDSVSLCWFCGRETNLLRIHPTTGEKTLACSNECNESMKPSVTHYAQHRAYAGPRTSCWETKDRDEALLRKGSGRG